MTRRGVLVAIAAVALLGGLVGAWLWRTPPTAPGPVDAVVASAPGTPAAAVDAAAPTTPAAAASAPRVHVPLPPPGTAPAQVVDALLAAADAGDTRAACRVAMELVGCQHAAGMIGEIAVRGDLAGMFGQDVADRQHAFDTAVDAHHRRCEEIDPAVHARTTELLRAAARAGEADAALIYAQGFHLMRRTSRDFIAHPGFEQWRAEAVPMLWRSFRAGDDRAAFLLAMGTAGDFGLLDGLIDDDPVTARALHLLRGRMSTRPSRHRPLPADQERRAAELAQRWHRQHFDDRVTSDILDMASAAPPTPWVGEPGLERCTGKRMR